MAAVVASEMPIIANQMPYHRRSGAIHCAPVRVISGGNRQGYVEAQHAAGAQHVRFRIGEDVVGVQVHPAAEHEDPRD
jgi:hypothetical protein